MYFLFQLPPQTQQNPSPLSAILNTPNWRKGFLIDSVVKKSVCKAVQSLGSIAGPGRSSGEGNSNPLQFSCLGNSRTEEPAGLQSIGSQSQMLLSDWTTRTTFKWAPFRSGLPILWISLASQVSFPCEIFYQFFVFKWFRWSFHHFAKLQIF